LKQTNKNQLATSGFGLQNHFSFYWNSVLLYIKLQYEKNKMSPHFWNLGHNILRSVQNKLSATCIALHSAVLTKTEVTNQKYGKPNKLPKQFV